MGPQQGETEPTGLHPIFSYARGDGDALARYVSRSPEAQAEEQSTDNRQARGSTPRRGTKKEGTDVDHVKDVETTESVAHPRNRSRKRRRNNRRGKKPSKG